MSKHWDPRIVPGRRRPRRRKRARTDLRELGAMVLIGLTAGVALTLWREVEFAPAPDRYAPAAAAAPAKDPWAESRRSRAILEAQEGPPPADAPGEKATGAPAERALPAAVHVIDGDTFAYAGTRIRVADIDTPELRGRCAYERDLAQRAAGRMGALLAAGPFELHRAGTRDEDNYGRKLRIVTRGGRSLGDRMVAEGLARTWTGHREPWC
jgi:endonuclease YncB( thermonuclease family)